MKHEEAWGLLGDYVDQDLSEAKTNQVEAHLLECQTCRHEVEQLRAIVDGAGALPRAIEPERDLWPGIKARVQAGRRSAEAGALERLLRSLRSWRGFWPAAVGAAAVAALALFVSLDTRDSGGPRPLPRGPVVAEREKPDPTASAVIEALEAECRQGDRELAGYASQEGVGRVFPVLGLIVENLRIIDASIAELREAWKANPSSPRVARMLAAAYRAKVALQGRASRVAAKT